MRLSVSYYPHDQMTEAQEVARTVEACGFDAFYCTDSTYRRDPWVVLAAAAAVTERIHLGPSAVRLALTTPLAAARALATLDELSGGRVDAVLGLGFASFMREQSVEQKFSAVTFVRESFAAIRLALRDDRPIFHGTYADFAVTDIPLTARAAQSALPLRFGSSGGPRLIELAGEIADGVHLAPGYMRSACEYLVAHASRGAARAGRDDRELELTAAPIVVCCEDGNLAREVARVHATFYMASMPRRLFETIRTDGLRFSDVERVKALWNAGDLRAAAANVPFELAALIAVAGTPDECGEQLRSNILGTGINHLSCMFADARHVELILGQAPVGVPSVREQIELFASRVAPTLRTEGA